jgi:hypothetical protein
MAGAGVRCIRCAQRITVHRTLCEGRQVRFGALVFGERPAARRRQRYILRRKEPRLDAIASKRFIDGDHFRLAPAAARVHATDSRLASRQSVRRQYLAISQPRSQSYLIARASDSPLDS